MTIGSDINVLVLITRNAFNLISSSCLCSLYFSIMRLIWEYGVIMSYTHQARD